MAEARSEARRNIAENRRARFDFFIEETVEAGLQLVGTEGNYGEQLGLSKDWAAHIIKLVGNYGESFERNVGSGSKLNIARGLNNLWTKGGIQYAPPIR